MPISNDYNMENGYVDYFCDYCGKEFRIKKREYKLLLDGQKKTLCCSRKCSRQFQRNGEYVMCDNCGKLIYRTQYRLNLREHQFCSLSCEKEYQHKETYEVRKCEICNTEFECSKTSLQRFCSNKCNSEWQKTQVGILNPKFEGVKKSCDYCKSTIYVTPYKLKQQNYFFCNEKCRQDWYANVYSQTETWKNKKRKDAASIISSGVISKVNSKPQQKIDLLLDGMNINYIREKNFEFYAADNYLEDYNLIIEVNGDYWHCSPFKYKNNISEMQCKSIRRDKAKHTYILNKYNINILYLWEYDINNNIDICKKLIELYISKNGILENYNSFNYQIDDNGGLKLKNNITLSYQEIDIKEYGHLIKKTS